MLLDGHDLDGIVAGLANSGQHVLAEIQVAVDLLRPTTTTTIAAHTHTVGISIKLTRHTFVTMVGRIMVGSNNMENRSAKQMD
jgi:hypothetical protein